MRRAALLSALMAPLLPGLAWGQATPERAAALQTQINNWFRSTLGRPAEPPPTTVTAADGHFDLTWRPFAGADAPVMKGTLTDAGSGRWAVDGLRLPSPSVFHFSLPDPKAPNAALSEATSTLTTGSGEQHALIDPSLASPSTMTATVADLDLTTQLPGTTQLTHVDNVRSNATLTPASDNKLDIASTAEMEGYSLKMSGTNGQPVAVTARKGTVAMIGTGVSRERGTELLRVLARLNRGPTTAAGPPPRDDMRALLAAAAGLMRGGSLQQQFDDVSITVRAGTGSLKRLAVGVVSELESEKLRARLPVAAEGLTLPELGLGPVASLLPTKLVLTPNVAGVPPAPLLALLQKAIDKQSPTDADIEALFAAGPLNAGIDDFALDVAGTSFAGHIGMLISSPALFSGTGQITADNIDRLQQAIAANPQTANFVPVIIFLKGVGRAEGGRLVWDLAYNDGHLLVNGQDMAALAGPPAPPARRR